MALRAIVRRRRRLGWMNRRLEKGGLKVGLKVGLKSEIKVGWKVGLEVYVAFKGFHIILEGFSALRGHLADCPGFSA